MAKTLTPAEITAAAVAEAEQAEQHAADLRAAVENGDATITPAVLAEADQAGMFARLRIKAAEKKAAAQADTDRHRRADAIAADARALAEQDDEADLAVKMRAAVDALAAVHAAAANRHDRIKEMARRVAVIKVEAEQAGVPDPRSRYGVGPTAVAGETGLIVGKTDPIAVRSVSPADAVAAVVGLAVSGDAVALKAATEACQYAAARADRVRRDVPAVGDAFAQPADRAA
ncbi:hypothetical protein [Streptomyces mutabilis]|uniref:hypothetical protein n=1 Tax=Streptomyces mutabilis TaxID=67332 RepID=UPI0022BA1610|nr:hypothetical protein [Streptomyces mutabilis]